MWPFGCRHRVIGRRTGVDYCLDCGSFRLWSNGPWLSVEYEAKRRATTAPPLHPHEFQQRAAMERLWQWEDIFSLRRDYEIANGRVVRWH